MTTSPLFTLDHCSVEADGKTILPSLSYEIGEGEFITITGPSGVGKTTLLQLLLGFVPPSSGEVRFRGQPLTPPLLKALRRETAVVFQEPVLAGQTVRQVLLHPFSYKRNRRVLPGPDRIASELEMVGLPRMILEGSVETLSGGEKQRVALVGALLMERPVLLLDEVTSALDSRHRDRVQEVLLRRGATVVAVSHDETWIERSPRLIEL